MKALDFYGWGLPSKGAYLNSYKTSDHLHDLASQFWNLLESGALFYILIFLGVALLCAIYYYYPYNNMPKRHYKMLHWGLWLGITALCTFAISAIVGFILFDSPMKEKTSFIMRISFINMIYGILMYLIYSIIICNLNMPKTNAYRFFKLFV